MSPSTNLRILVRLICLLACGLASSGGALPQRPQYESGLPGVTVKDVQRILTEDKNERDAQVAHRLSGLALTQRMSDATLGSLEKSVPGKKSRWALIALADASVFLDPEPADLIPQAPPDLDEQRHIGTLTGEYLVRTLPKLPDFYATRTTVRFADDVRRANHAKATSPYDSSWRELSSSNAIVAYRDGKEVVNPREWGKHPSRPHDRGLITRGTFGPILSIVIEDAAHGEMIWDHWERGSTGNLAVFSYRVPESQSHYSVGFHGPSGDTGAEGRPTEYHGEVAIDPASGTIMRVTLQADQPFGSPILRSDIMVQYGPVEIGGKIYTCPVRSVSISLDAAGLTVGLGPFDRPATPGIPLLNDVTFGDYHLFRSESRILTGDLSTPNQ
jgi:hypothetical protein